MAVFIVSLEPLVSNGGDTVSSCFFYVCW